MSLKTFIRSNLTSLFTTAIDVGTLALLAKGLGVNYVLSTWLGTVVASVTNFLINKHWAFEAHGSPHGRQLARFVVVQAAASGLSTFGVWALKRYGGLELLVARLVTAGVVYLFWNYPLNRFFVFRHARQQPRHA